MSCEGGGSDSYNTTYDSSACDPLDLEEVALVCFACFTAQYQLPNSDQWLKIVDKLEKHKGPIPDITMGILAKYLRYIQPKRTYEYAATARLGRTRSFIVCCGYWLA